MTIHPLNIPLMKPSNPHPDSNLGQCAPNDTKFPFAANASDQTSSHETQFPPPLGGFAIPDNQGASPIWHLKKCWFSHVEAHREFHVTIAVRKVSDREPNNTGFFAADAADNTSSHTMKILPLFPDISTALDRRAVPPLWDLNTCWVSHAEQDELHVTLAVRNNDSPESEPNNTGSSFAADAANQPFGHTMQFSPLILHRRLVAPDIQPASPLWQVNKCWVSHAEQAQVHVTIAVRKASESGPNNNGSSFATGAADQTSSPTIQVPPIFPGAAQENQGTLSVWYLSNCWVSHAEQDELHVTIALGKSLDLEMRTLTISVG